MPSSVRTILLDTFRQYSLDAVIAFMGINYYGLSISVVADGLRVSSDVVASWNRSIRSDVRRSFRQDGGVIGRDGCSVAVFDEDGVIQEVDTDNGADTLNWEE